MSEVMTSTRMRAPTPHFLVDFSALRVECWPTHLAQERRKKQKKSRKPDSPVGRQESTVLSVVKLC